MSWRLALGASRPPESVVAHSYSMFEFLLYTREGREAVAVDVHRGLVWREPVTGGRYVGRGLRVEGKSIVDTGGQTLLKLGLEPRTVVYGRRLVAIGDEKRMRLVDRSLLEEVGEVDARKSRVVSDEYTLLVYGRVRRGYLLAVDSISGFSVERMKRSVRKLIASRGCFAACDNTGCIVGNGSIEASTTVDTKPLTALKGGCLVALNAEKGSIIAVVESEGSIEVIDSCNDMPEVVYSDGILAAYTCDDSVRLVKSGSPIPEYIHAGGVLVTPSYRARVEEGEVKLLNIMYGEDVEVLLPVEHYMVVHRDSIMALSGGWLYSIDLGDPAEMEVEEGEDAECPMKIRVSVEGYHILGLEARGEHVETAGVEPRPMGGKLCLRPLKLQGVYNLRLEAKLAPPMVVEASVSLQPPKPRIRAVIIEAREAEGIALLYSDGRMEGFPANRAVLVEIHNAWFKPLKGLRLLLVEGGRVTYETRISDRSVILMPLKLSGEPRVVVDAGDVSLEYAPEDVASLKPLGEISLAAVDPLDVRRASIMLEGVDAEAVLLDGARCIPYGRDSWRCVTNVWLDTHEICTCRRAALQETTLLCACRKLDLGHSIRSRYASVASLSVADPVQVDSRNPVLQLHVHLDEGGMLPVEVEVGDRKVIRVMHVGRGQHDISLKLPRLQEGVYNARISAAARDKLLDASTIIVYSREPSIIYVEASGRKIICSDVNIGLRLNKTLLTLKPGECIETDVEPELVAALDTCGYSVEAKPVKLNIEKALTTAAAAAWFIARAAKVKL